MQRTEALLGLCREVEDSLERGTASAEKFATSAVAALLERIQADRLLKTWPLLTTNVRDIVTADP